MVFIGHQPHGLSFPGRSFSRERVAQLIPTLGPSRDPDPALGPMLVNLVSSPQPK
jgi:hypothetical protein